MPRKARIIVPGVVYHVMAHGIDGRAIVNDDADRHKFVSLLSAAINNYQYQCYAWVVLDTHYHILIRLSENPLSKMMRWLNSSYSRYYNDRNHRKGYLFQDRYKSIAAQDQNYLEELVRYIHLNPYRAGMCKTLEKLDSYQWCGHAAIMGRVGNEFQNVIDVLKRFHINREKAIQNYRKYLEAGICGDISENVLEVIRKSNEGKTNILHTGSWVIGDHDFVTRVVAKDQENRLRIARYAKEGIQIEDIISKVSQFYKIPSDVIKKRSHGGIASEAKKVFIYASTLIYGFPVVTIAKYLGLSGPAVSIALKQGERIVMNKDMLIYF